MTSGARGSRRIIRVEAILSARRKIVNNRSRTGKTKKSVARVRKILSSTTNSESVRLKTNRKSRIDLGIGIAITQRIDNPVIIKKRFAFTKRQLPRYDFDLRKSPNLQANTSNDLLVC